MTCIKSLFIILFFFIHSFSYALDSTVLEKQAEIRIKQLYHTLSSMKNTSMTERIVWISQQFLGKKYVLNALGEGPEAPYDQYPQYRVDGFDCDTFVNTVLSLALANSVESFQQCQKWNRYKDGKVDYTYRNHFTSLDWNQNNQKRGILQDITLHIKNHNKQSVALYAQALIDKPNWYAHKTIDTIRIHSNDPENQKQLLDELKEKGKHLASTTVQIPYIPLTALFIKNNQPDLYLFSQIPSGSIVEIVRPNWDLRDKIGTCLNVSHLGFAIRDKDQLYFRQASSELGKVVDVPLVDYLAKVINSPTIKGINVQIILPVKPLNKGCSGN